MKRLRRLFHWPWPKGRDSKSRPFLIGWSETITIAVLRDHGAPVVFGRCGVATVFATTQQEAIGKFRVDNTTASINGIA